MYIFALIAIMEIITTKLEIAVQKPKGTKSVQTIKKTDENLYDNDNDLEWSFDEYSLGKMKMLDVCRFLGNPVELMVVCGTSHFRRHARVEREVLVISYPHNAVAVARVGGRGRG